MLQFYVIIFSIFYEKKDASAKFQYFNPNWHELKKQGKCSSLAPPGIKFYKIQYAWQGVKLTKMMSIFTSKKVWKIHLKKTNPKIKRGVKVPCLMPNRVSLPNNSESTGLN